MPNTLPKKHEKVLTKMKRAGEMTQKEEDMIRFILLNQGFLTFLKVRGVLAPQDMEEMEAAVKDILQDISPPK